MTYEQQLWIPQAGLMGEEDYMAVLLARLDILRHRGAAAAHELRVAFKAAVELMQVGDMCWPVPQLGLVHHTIKSTPQLHVSQAAVWGRHRT